MRDGGEDAEDRIIVMVMTMAMVIVIAMMQIEHTTLLQTPYHLLLTLLLHLLPLSHLLHLLISIIAIHFTQMLSIPMIDGLD